MFLDVLFSKRKAAAARGLGDWGIDKAEKRTAKKRKARDEDEEEDEGEDEDEDYVDGEFSRAYSAEQRVDLILSVRVYSLQRKMKMKTCPIYPRKSPVNTVGDLTLYYN